MKTTHGAQAGGGDWGAGVTRILERGCTFVEKKRHRQKTNF